MSGDPIRIRAHPELQHTLAHLIEAMDALLAGQKQLARHHLEVVRSAVLWEDDATAEAELNGLHETEEGQEEKGQEVEIPMICPKCLQPRAAHWGWGHSCPPLSGTV